MIFDNMKLVLESEKCSNVDLEITEQDILTYFSFQLKVSEEYIFDTVIPLISKFANNDETLEEDRKEINGKVNHSWKLKTVS
jgi:hypothetical protein